MATSLNDQWTLSQDGTFQGRVRQAACTAAMNIHNEAFTALTPQRDAFGKNVLLNNVTNLQQLLAIAVAADATVAGLAGSPAVQGSVTDAAIANAVASCWNSFAVRD